ncbi:MAG: CHAP domain-containing protein, partial [Bacteroidales bacterium]|nr:CHAP domain-containing protein [Bacteroidales bacterium]
ARKYGVREAQRATYRDESSIANTLAMMTRINKPLGVLVESMFPFKKTPINVAKRGMEYSPLGFAKVLAKGLIGLKKGNYSATELIDDLGAAFSGSVMMALGVGFASLGLLVGPEDDEEKSLFEQLNGMQNYSIKLGDSTYTIDWLSPSAIPLFAGVELWKGLDDGELTFAEIANILPKMIAPLFDTTMLEGVVSTIEEISYADNIWWGLASSIFTMPLDLAGQAVPTAFGQVARTIDNTKRKTYVDKNSKIPEWLQVFYQQQAKKIPFLTYALTPYVNAKGEVEKNAEGNIVVRALQNLLSPGYYKKIKKTDVDNELSRLYDALGVDVEDIIPKKAYQSIIVKGENGEKKEVYLSEEQWVDYQTTAGKAYYDKLEDIIKSDFYQDLSDEKKVELIKAVRTYSDDLGKQAAVPEYQIYKEEAKTYLDNGLFEYVIEPEDKEATFNVKDLSPEDRKKYTSDRDKMFEEIISNYSFGVKDYELNDKFYDDVYNYADKVMLEKYSDGKYTYDTIWFKNAKTLDNKELAQYFYGKGIIKSFDGQEEAQKKANEAIANDKKISDKVKAFLLQKSSNGNYDSGVMYDRYVKQYNVDPALYGKLWQYKNMSDSDEVKKKDVIAKIHSQKLSNEQKSAIYRSFGYGESENALKGVPWRYVEDNTTSAPPKKSDSNSNEKIPGKPGERIANTHTYNNSAAKGQCVWYVRGRANEKLGATIPAIGDGNGMYYGAKDSAKVKADPDNLRGDMIVSYSKGSGSLGQKYGHVIYIEAVVGDTV